MTNLLIVLLIGAALGGVAHRVMREGGFGIFGNVFLGMLGAWLGSNVPIWLEMETSGWDVRFLTAAAGAAIILFIIGLFTRS